MALSKKDLVEYLYQLVFKAQGKKQLKAMDLQKAVLKEHPDQPKNDIKFAIKDLIDGGRCVYTYFGGSYIEIPHEEGAAKKV
ncbi:MAG: hypothetical protein A2Y80_01595 [Deltaproteobacteria bacterium RBG_13_58_19]|nr:MAG: hypothetical protein A2Y80_01595 [Deltaproteobacteria bacterium RBG_13_58_19]